MSEPNKNRSGYKETKVGWIPDTWEAAQYQDVTVFSGGYGFPEDLQNEASDGVPFIKVSDMNRAGNERLILTASNYVSPETVEENRWKPFPPNATVFAKVGAALLLNRRRMLRYPTLIDNNMMAAVPMKGVNALFLFYSLQSLDLKRLVAVGALPSVNQRDLNTARLPLPPINECGRIADILSTCDEVIEKTSALIDAKKRQKKALMQQLLTGKKRLPGFEGEWMEVVLDSLCTRLKEVAENPDGYPVLSITARTGFVSQEDKFSRVIAGKQVENYVVLKRGDFAYNKGNSYLYPQGCVYQLSEYDEGLVPNVFYSFRLDEACADADFIKQYFLAGLHNKDLYRWINSGVRNNGLLNLNASDFFKLPISLPPLPEQKAIGNVFREADTELRALDEKLKTLKQQKKALMQKLLTGQVRVKV